MEQFSNEAMEYRAKPRADYDAARNMGMNKKTTHTLASSQTEKLLKAVEALHQRIDMLNAALASVLIPEHPAHPATQTCEVPPLRSLARSAIDDCVERLQSADTRLAGIQARFDV